MRVLVVEDEQGIRRMLRQVLSELGFEVMGVGDGDEALSIYKEQGPFHCVLTDLSHPGADALYMGWAIRRLNPTQTILIITGSPHSPLAQGIRKEFPDIKFLEKPMLVESLKETLRELLSTPRG